MKKLLMLSLILLLAACLLASCGGNGDDTTTTTTANGGGTPGSTTAAIVTTAPPKAWNSPKLAMFGDEIITWASDENADFYEVYLNGTLCDTVANEYCELPLAEGQSATVKVVKVIGNERYHSEELTITRQFRATHTVRSLSELSGVASNGTVSLGGLTEAAVVLDLSGESGTKAMPTSLTLNTTLSSLTIIGNSSLILTNVTIKVAERTDPLTIIFRNVNLKTTSSTMLYYTGNASFSCDMLIEDTCSFSNTKTGTSGTRGGDASGFASAGSGTTGGSGGDLFSLPSVRLFCKSLPAFTTGWGGSGGDGGTGKGLAHGGFGGNGGRGGSVFYNSNVTCFNTFFGELTGDFGLGGPGGSGGTGFSGPRSDGTRGSNGTLSYGGSFTYLSRTDGINHTLQGDSQSGDFNLSAVNGYLIWNAQPSATRYEILYNDQVYDTTTLNAYVLPPLLGDPSAVLVRAILPSGDTRISKPCAAVTYDYTEFTPTENTAIITGAKNVQINADALKDVYTILVMPDVEHLSLITNGTERAIVEAAIVANNRTTNLVITLTNVALTPVLWETNAITVNNGQAISAATDPLLIINAHNSAIVGGEGRPGTDGNDSGGVSFGGNGANGATGADGIAAPLVVITGTDLAVQGGSGGDGGNGGDSELNEGGDGGNGGDGGTAVRTSHLYILMNERNSVVTLYPGNAGSLGYAGEGFFGDASSSLTSAENGKPGSAGTTVIGAETILNGQINR